MVGQDFSVSGPNDGHFCPETYFDVEVLTRGLVAVKMVWEWRDQVGSIFILFLLRIYCFLTFGSTFLTSQGYGNQKGQLWLQLVRDGQVSSILQKHRKNHPPKSNKIIASNSTQNPPSST